MNQKGLVVVVVAAALCYSVRTMIIQPFTPFETLGAPSNVKSLTTGVYRKMLNAICKPQYS
jgi:uncharacterized membrane protein YvlD (DUF360 family)